MKDKNKMLDIKVNFDSHLIDVKAHRALKIFLENSGELNEDLFKDL